MKRKNTNDFCGYFDVHSHILPGLDDGAGSWEEAYEMLKLAYAQGIRKILATPHFMPERQNASCKTVKEKAAYLQDYADKNGYDIQIYSGNEIYYHEEAVNKLEQEKVLTLADTSFVLVEFSPADDFRYMYNSLAELLAEGYIPIIAHAERYEAVRHLTRERVTDLKKMGVLIQINASAVEGKHGKPEKKTVYELLKYQLVDFVATDSHSMKDRAPYMEKCRKIIKRKCSTEYAEQLFYKNAENFFLQNSI